MKLIVQIPCLNESASLPETLRRIPRRVDGIDRVEILVVDDGSTDRTAAVARAGGADHILRFPVHRGLARAFAAGLDHALRLGADVIVNLDADGQYDPEAIPRLIDPILTGRAEVAIGERDMRAAAHFSPFKKLLQRLGSRVVRILSGTGVEDAASGFRAFSREAALQLNVVSDFSYTLETILQAGSLGLALAGVPVKSRPVRRESRLFRSIPAYLRRSAGTLARISTLYRPVRVFSAIALLIFASGSVLLGRFLYFYFLDPARSGHVQSLIVASILFTLSFLLAIAGLVAWLVSINRRLLEDVLVRVRRLELPGRDGLPDPAPPESRREPRRTIPFRIPGGNGDRTSGPGSRPGGGDR